MKIRILLFISFLSFQLISSQQLSSKAEISILTIGQGTSLNDSFGHSAFRIQDKALGIDLVYNYGIYDFKTPNFYTKFVQGKLNYLLGRNYYEDFFNAYMLQNRTIRSQTLNLTLDEKQLVYDYLINNFKPENKRYLYDFFYDNCATRIKDVLQNALNNSITFHEPKEFKPETFRTLIHENLDYNTWGSLGIDLALGSVIDQTATPEEHMFLPKYIHTFFNNATLGNKKLVKSQETLYKKRDVVQQKSFLTSPLMVFGILGLLIIGVTYLDYKKKRRSKYLDTILFTTTSIIGIFLLLLWFATDHSATAQNYNLLWAFPINFLLLMQINKQSPKRWLVKFLKFLLIMLCLMTMHWLGGVQIFALGLMPILVALLIRYLFLINYFKRNKA